MIEHFLITGDTHGRVEERIQYINSELYPPETTAIVILGDVGLNFYLNKTDKNIKRNLQATGYTIYCLRGNHEERPENLPSIEPCYDERVQGWVMFEREYPNILYLRDGIEYKFFEWSVLTIGGAYSVDKDYRLSKRQGNGWCGWFEDEQLYDWERAEITDRIKGNHYNLVLTHTCPISFEPTDLFLSFIDQSTVDKTMENWLEELKTKIIWDKWLFGHYHADRQIGPDVQMFYKGIVDLEEIMND